MLDFMLTGSIYKLQQQVLSHLLLYSHRIVVTIFNLMKRGTQEAAPAFFFHVKVSMEEANRCSYRKELNNQVALLLTCRKCLELPNNLNQS